METEVLAVEEGTGCCREGKTVALSYFTDNCTQSILAANLQNKSTLKFRLYLK